MKKNLPFLQNAFLATMVVVTMATPIQAWGQNLKATAFDVHNSRYVTHTGEMTALSYIEKDGDYLIEVDSYLAQLDYLKEDSENSVTYYTKANGEASAVFERNKGVIRSIDGTADVVTIGTKNYISQKDLMIVGAAYIYKSGSEIIINKDVGYLIIQAGDTKIATHFYNKDNQGVYLSLDLIKSILKDYKPTKPTELSYFELVNPANSKIIKIANVGMSGTRYNILELLIAGEIDYSLDDTTKTLTINNESVEKNLAVLKTSVSNPLANMRKQQAETQVLKRGKVGTNFTIPEGAVYKETEWTVKDGIDTGTLGKAYIAGIDDYIWVGESVESVKNKLGTDYKLENKNESGWESTDSGTYRWFYNRTDVTRILFKNNKVIEIRFGNNTNYTMFGNTIGQQYKEVNNTYISAMATYTVSMIDSSKNLSNTINGEVTGNSLGTIRSMTVGKSNYTLD